MKLIVFIGQLPYSYLSPSFFGSTVWCYNSTCRIVSFDGAACSSDSFTTHSTIQLCFD